MRTRRNLSKWSSCWGERRKALPNSLALPPSLFLPLSPSFPLPLLLPFTLSLFFSLSCGAHARRMNNTISLQHTFSHMHTQRNGPFEHHPRGGRADDWSPSRRQHPEQQQQAYFPLGVARHAASDEARAQGGGDRKAQRLRISNTLATH